MSVFGIFLILAVVAAIVAVIVIALTSKKSPPAVDGESSVFDGKTLQLIGYRILSAFVTTITLGIAYPWMLCMVKRWEVKHTVIHGRRLKFTGHGHQLIGKYLLWVFLTIITLGIYSIWLGLGMKKWVVKHTVYADEDKPVDSYFSGGVGGYLGIHILAFILTVFTLGIGKAWADTMVLRWEAGHTHIGGSPLVFSGSGGQLLGKYLLLILLTPLTLGIYALCFPVILLKWQTKHTDAVYQTSQIRAKAIAHETTALQDFAKYRIAANDQELAAVKSGYTGTEDLNTLEQMAADGNPFAAYHLAKQIKGENALYEGKALDWLQRAADGKVHSALLDLAKQAPSEDKISLLTQAVQGGNAEASWLLAVEYQNAKDLPQAAYWFKIALEWANENAKAHAPEYDELVKNIALQLSEANTPKKQSNTLGIVLGIVGGIIVLVGILLAIAAFFFKVPIRNHQVSPALRTEPISFVQSIASDNVNGELWKMEDSRGNDVEFIFNENVFFDYQENALYLEVATVKCEDPLFLRDSTNGWRTEPFTDSGILKIDIPNGAPVNDVEMMVQYSDGTYCGLITFTLNKTEGTTEEAQTWIAEKHVADQPQTQPTTESTAPATETTAPATETTAPTSAPSGDTSSIVGTWENTDIATDMETGVDTLMIWRWTFNQDGTATRITYRCEVNVNGNEYYYGRAWSRVGGDRGDGTYTLAGNTLTVTIHDVNGGSDYTTVYEAEFGDGGLHLSSANEIPRTYIKTN